MKKSLMIMALLVYNAAAYAQSQEIKQLLLNIEKLAQLKTMLSNMKKGYRVLWEGYGKVEEGAKSAYGMHATYLEGLLQINPLLTSYKKTTESFAMAKSIVEDIGSIRKSISSVNHLTGEEKAYLFQVYTTLVKATARDVGELGSLLTPRVYRMGDGERLEAIDEVHLRLLDRKEFMRQFLTSQRFLSSQRRGEILSRERLKNWYGLKD